MSSTPTDALTLSQAVLPTTFVRPQSLADRLGVELTIASEAYQRTGSFKFRAAYNLALQAPQGEIIAASSGNFGQALAYACKLLKKRCVVVMPSTSAAVKIAAVRRYGAVVDLIDTRTKSRAARVAELAAGRPGAYVASAYDDALVIEGNATLGSELASAAQRWDAILAPVGGGGLISGIATGLRRAGNKTELLGAEPALANDAARSLRAGRILTNESEPATIADGARTLSLGRLNWSIVQREVRDIIEVSEQNIAEALRLLFTLANLKAEPTGALAVGAILEQPQRFAGRSVCCIVSGGNVDPAVYAQLLLAGEQDGKGSGQA
ncbi:MAG TPA: pyridoxal-phosphate dependent enzyme [Candidatus Acidoferrales bacterium]|nr:pyridoxal-phosphate dependent enzyme [Candidatus Acidoferrales bacterium]